MLRLDQTDIDAIDKAAGRNGWQVLEVCIKEAHGRGTLRNGVVLCRTTNKYAIHVWSMQEDGRVGLHNGTYVQSWAEGLGAYNRRCA